MLVGTFTLVQEFQYSCSADKVIIGASKLVLANWTVQEFNHITYACSNLLPSLQAMHGQGGTGLLPSGVAAAAMERQIKWHEQYQCMARGLGLGARELEL